MLSIIILTKNSESTIADCLESLKGLGDEVIIVDSDSTDRTVEVSKHLGAKVYNHPLIGFSDQRNFAMEKARGPWVLYIDSDEQATKDFNKEIITILENHQNDSEINGYYLKRKTYYLGKDWNFSDQVQRLFYKPKFKEWYGVVHETPRIEGEFGIIESPILHFTHRNLSQMVEKTNEWSEYEAELRKKAHHPKMTSWRFFRVMLTGFFGSYIMQKGYKNGTEGLIEAIFQSYSMFITYAKLWEKQTK